MFEEMIATAKEARIPLELVYAMRKTGRIVTERNNHLLSPEEMAEWDAAINQFKSLQ